jgi:hypothetical protein
MKTTQFISTLVAMLCFSSCATLFTGSKRNVVFDSDVALSKPVILTVDGRKYTDVRFPYTVKVKGGFNDSMAKAEVEGYKPSVVTIDKVIQPVTFLNFLGWWFIGFGIDAATGAMMRPEYSNYIFELQPTN